MDILPLLDELRVIAQNGLHYAQNSYDHERYSRLLDLVSQYYGHAVDLPAAEVRQRLAAEVGHITPKVGAAAAVFDAQGRILLMQRADNNLWGLPGGWSEPHESPATTAVRETREETGLEVRPLQLVNVFTRLAAMDTGAHTLVAVIYLCEAIGGTLQGSPEGLDVRFWEMTAVTQWHAASKQYAEAAAELWKARQAGV